MTFYSNKFKYCVSLQNKTQYFVETAFSKRNTGKIIYIGWAPVNWPANWLVMVFLFGGKSLNVAEAGPKSQLRFLQNISCSLLPGTNRLIVTPLILNNNYDNWAWISGNISSFQLPPRTQVGGDYSNRSLLMRKHLEDQALNSKLRN